jgi:phage tail sheath protein FI
LNGQPYSIVAGPRRGVLSNPRLVSLEYEFTDADRGFLEPFGWNPIVFRNNVGFMIFGNQTAYQKTLTAFNNLHVRDLLITIEESVEDVLANYLYEFNDATTRLEIKSIVDRFLDNVRSAGGIYDYRTVMDTTNNTNEIIDQNFAIIDIGIEPVRGAQKFINRITVLKTGQIASGGFSVA